MEGTDLVATTADDGLFVISGVPPGLRRLIFTVGAMQSSVSVDVPANATVEIGRVDISDTRAEIANVRVEQHAPPPPTSQGNQAPGNDNASDRSNMNASPTTPASANANGAAPGNSNANVAGNSNAGGNANTATSNGNANQDNDNDDGDNDNSDDDENDHDNDDDDDNDRGRNRGSGGGN